MPAVYDSYDRNQLLTNMSVAYRPKNLIAPDLFPTLPVKKEDGKYFVKDRENMRAPMDVSRSEYSEANIVSNSLTQAPYTLNEKALETRISDRLMQNYDDPFEPKQNAMNLVEDKLAIFREMALRDKILASGGANNNIDLAGSWSTPSTDIIGQAEAAKDYILRNTGMDANVCVIGKQAIDQFKKNSAVIERIKYVARADNATILAAMADFLGVDRILQAKGTFDTSKSGQPSSNATRGYIWGSTVAFAYVAPAPALETPSAGYCLQLEGWKYIDEWYDQKIKSTYVRSNDFYDDFIVDPDCMFVYRNAAA